MFEDSVHLIYSSTFVKLLPSRFSLYDESYVGVYWHKSSDAFDDKTTYFSGTSFFVSFSTKFNVAPLEWVRCNTLPVSLGCLHTSSASFSVSISDWVQRSELLRIISFINPWFVMPVIFILMKQRNTCLTLVLAALKSVLIALLTVSSTPYSRALFIWKLLRFFNSIATSGCSSESDESLQRNSVPSLSLSIQLGWMARSSAGASFFGIWL